jgi:3-hydroxymyristoyl/3-hydroxydecanoyl-(acyl carrier protein) dehydratase
VNVSIEVSADDPLFEGHFPGRPILPGISELVLVWRALSHPSGPANVCAIPFARFRGLVVPSDVLQISVEPRGEGGVRFEVRRAAALVANGALTFGVPPVEDGGATAVASRAPRGAPSLRDLIPHRPPMLFVERIVGVAEDGATCIARVPGDCALVADGTTPAFVALEAAAQTAAVWEALRRPRASVAEEPRMGYLVSLKDIVLHRLTIPADVDLIASVRLVAEAAALTTYAVEVTVEGTLALRGTIGTYLSG